MQRRLSQMFREREIQKRYIAVVLGQLHDEAGEIDLPLNSDWPNRPRQMIDYSTGKYSLTRYRCTGFDATTGYSRMELEPVTGRTHQLRVHLSAIGHPIVGDTLYGGPSNERLQLHAQSLIFPHPVDATVLNFVSVPPF
jgi:tRNA pseudouridine32 synthase / 23S rRNA pseudouridine746 synthase